MPRSFQEIIRLIANGDPVDSSINTIFRALAGNVEYVKLLLDEAALGSKVVHREVTVHSSVEVGQPVYFDTVSQSFKQALAVTSIDIDTDATITAPSARVWGICYYKHNSTKADILLSGCAEVDMTEAITGSVPGIYYLSGSTAGKLVSAIPSVAVPVLFWDGDSTVYVNVSFNNEFFPTEETVVTSLQAVEGSGLTITCVQDGSEQITGDLQIDFDPDILADDGDEEPGHIVFKRYEDQTLFKGPVVEALVVESDYIIASSTAENEDDQHQGIVTLSFTPTPVGAELAIEQIRLSNALEENYEDVVAIGFPENVDAEFRAKVNIPANIEATTVTIRLRFVVLARVAGDIPALTLTARSVTRPGQTTGSSLALPTADSSITLSVAGVTGMVEDNYVELQSSPITTSPGAFVLFTLSREGSADSFAGDLHVIDQRAVVNTIV